MSESYYGNTGAMNMRPSRVLRKLREGKVATCVKLNLLDPRVAEIAAMCGVDCIWIDMEHVPTDYATVENMVRAAKNYDTDILTRVARGPYSNMTVPLEADSSGIMVPHLMRHSSGAIICSYGRREEPFGQRVLISYDDGKTWSKDAELRSNFEWDMGYPCSVELADGSILTVYYQRLPGDVGNSFLYTRWTLDEV